MAAAIYDVKRLSQADNFEQLAVRGWKRPAQPGQEELSKPIYSSKDVYMLRIYSHNPAYATIARKSWRYTVEVFAGVRVVEGFRSSLRDAKIEAVRAALGHALLGVVSDG